LPSLFPLKLIPYLKILLLCGKDSAYLISRRGVDEIPGIIRRNNKSSSPTTKVLFL